ncbi:hypothetical protein GQ457_07G042990 [Hibiscus cannabinus]
MDASTRQHQGQEMANSSLENMSVNSNGQQERKPRPQHEEALRCPRCDSTNTKFCYYNNYSLSQPRYFCKSCRRYWTKGGTLRNVPVGGGCRKNKRSSSKRSQDQPLTHITNPLITTTTTTADLPVPALNYDTSDLSLAFARLQKQPSFPLGFDDVGNPSFSSTLRSSFLGNQNFCYEVENYMGFNGELMVPYNIDEMKQELSMADFDSGRGSWNGFNSTWHGLLNSPLM